MRACPPVLIDSTELHQIAMNLSTNAWQAMEEEGGELRVCLTHCVIDPGGKQTADPTILPGEYVCFTVRDTGERHG